MQNFVKKTVNNNIIFKDLKNDIELSVKHYDSNLRYDSLYIKNLMKTHLFFQSLNKMI